MSILDSTSWNDEQLAFITSPHVNSTLIGIPGGGKTRSIIGRVIYLYESGILSATENVLILTFTNAARNDIIAKGLAATGRSDIFNTHNIKTLHKLCGSILSTTKSISDDDLYGSSLSTLIYRKLEELRTWTPEQAKTQMSTYASIFVDEAQDLSKEQYELVVEISRLFDCPVSMIGDPNQTIFQFQGASARYLETHSPKNVFVLVVNYRSTSDLIRLANKIRPNIYTEMRSARHTSDDDAKPRFLVGSIGQIAEDLICVVNSLDGLIAVIGPVKKAKPIESKRGSPYKSIGLQWAHHLLRDAGFDCEVHYDESSETSDADAKKILRCKAFETSKIHFMTIHQSKGLEFDHTIVLNYHYATQNANPKNDEKIEELRRLWFVAFTRAKKSINFYAIEHNHVWIDYGFKDLSSLITHAGADPKILRKKPKFKDSDKQTSFGWTNVIKSRELMSIKLLAELEDLFLKNIKPIRSDDNFLVPQQHQLLEFDKLSVVYGSWAEELFYYCYIGSSPILDWVSAYCSNRLVYNNTYDVQVRRLMITLGLPRSKELPVALIKKYMPTLESKFLSLMVLIRRWMSKNPDCSHLILVSQSENIVQYTNDNVVRAIVNKAKNSVARGCLSSSEIWWLCMYKYQYECEARWRFEKLFKHARDYVSGLAAYEVAIRKWASELPPGFQVQKVTAFHHVPEICGIIDLVNEDTQTVIELKFSSAAEISATHILQALGYHEMIFGADEKRKTTSCVQVWNLMSGERVEVPTPLGNKTRYKIYEHLANALNLSMTRISWICSFVVLDDSEIEVHVQDINTNVVPVSEKCKIKIENEDSWIARFIDVARAAGQYGLALHYQCTSHKPFPITDPIMFIKTLIERTTSITKIVDIRLAKFGDMSRAIGITGCAKTNAEIIIRALKSEHNHVPFFCKSNQLGVQRATGGRPQQTAES